MKRFLFFATSILFIILLSVPAYAVTHCPNHPDATPYMMPDDEWYTPGNSPWGEPGHIKYRVHMFHCPYCNEAWPDDYPINDGWSPHHSVPHGSVYYRYTNTNTTHTRITVTPLWCDDCYVNLSTETSDSPEAHIGSINNWYDAGHVGVYHYYDSDCTICGRRFQWRKIICPGGNNHVAPSGLFIPDETE
jgi:hypothetical protein